MALQPRKRSRSTIVNADSVEQASLFLQELPEKQKENLSLREAVGQMQDSIKAALNKGYTYDELAKMLASQGIQISAFTLKNYVPSGKRSASKTKTPRAKKLKDEGASQQLDLSELEADENGFESSSAAKEDGAAAKTSDATASSEKSRRGRQKPTSSEDPTKPKTAAAKKPSTAKSTTKASTTTTRGRKRATA